jgi:nucleoside-diphosphate-sugar epimerase
LYSAIQASQNKILEFFAYEYGISITKIFQADTYGPNDWRPKLLSAVINSIKNNKVLNVGSPNQIIAPIYISDVIGDLIDIMDSASFGDNLLNQVQLMPDKVYTLKKFIDKIEIVTQKTVLVNWNTKANIRADIENFPIMKNIHKNKNKRVILEKGLNEVLRII